MQLTFVLNRSAFFLLQLLALFLTVGAKAELKPLNSDFEAGSTLSASTVAQRIKDAIPPVQDKYLLVKNNREYAAIRQSEEWRKLRLHTARLRSVDLHSLDSDAKKTAFWINVYNVLVNDGIISLHVKGSVTKSPDFFRRACYNVGGLVFSLEDIEHGILRGNRPSETGGSSPFKSNDSRLAFKVSHFDPRIHFALNCGAKSCPTVHIYTETQLDEQLETAAKSFINGPDVKLDSSRNTLQISQIFEWYAQDFGTNNREVIAFICRFLPEPVKGSIEAKRDKLSVKYLPYDWSLIEGGQ